MITAQEVDNALKIIMEYKLQVEQASNKTSFNSVVNIQKEISFNTFYSLQLYFKDVHNENITSHDLRKMSLEKLNTIDYSKLRNYRGFGRVSEQKLKKLIESFNE